MICNCGSFIELKDGFYQHVTDMDMGHDAHPMENLTASSIETAFRMWVTLYPDKQTAVKDIRVCLNNKYIRNMLANSPGCQRWEQIASGKVDYYLNEELGVIVRLSKHMPVIPPSKGLFELDYAGILIAISYALFCVWHFSNGGSPFVSWSTLVPNVLLIAFLYSCLYLLNKVGGIKKDAYLIYAKDKRSLNVRTSKISVNSKYSLSPDDLDQLQIGRVIEDGYIVLFNKINMEAEDINAIYETYSKSEVSIEYTGSESQSKGDRNRDSD